MSETVWRALVKLASEHTTGTWPYDSALANVLDHLITVENSGGSGEGCADALARIVAVAEGQVGDGWKADPSRVPHGHWGVAWLLAPLSHEPPDWPVVADRSAAWLRSLLDGAS